MTHSRSFPFEPGFPLELDPTVKGRLSAATFQLAPVRAGARPPGLDDELNLLTEHYRSIWSGPTEAAEALKPARKLYHALGIDPSKTRPSSEALLRRVLQGKGLYNVNAVVDAANLASLTLLLPVGLYDASRIHPPVMLRMGRDAEEYDGIRKDTIHLHGRPALFDAQGPFGNPTADSLRTSVTESTEAVWFVLFAPVDYPHPTLEDDLRRAYAILSRHASHLSSSPEEQG
jgi:DNA/RNA-binding domain of Phe-tRNA-synthetase-like protein